MRPDRVREQFKGREDNAAAPAANRTPRRPTKRSNAQILPRQSPGPDTKEIGNTFKNHSGDPGCGLIDPDTEDKGKTFVPGPFAKLLLRRMRLMNPVA